MNVVIVVYVAVFEVVSSLNAGLSPVYMGGKEFFTCIVGDNLEKKRPAGRFLVNVLEIFDKVRC